MKRPNSRMRPQAEGLEDRQLLAQFSLPNGTRINYQDLQHLRLQRQNNVPLNDRQMQYRTPDGAVVTLRLYGAGSLKGTAVRADGTLDLVYNGTNIYSVISSSVRGGTAAPKLGSVRDADVVDINNLSVGSNLVKTVNLSKFELVSGGQVNLMGGVGIFNLDTADINSQINLRSVPNFNAQPTQTGSVNSQVTTTLNNGTQVLTTVNNTATSTATYPTTVTQNGLTYNYTDQSNGGRALVSVTGTFVPGANLQGTRATNAAGPTPAPAGMIVSINNINGAPSNTPTLSDTQLFGYDATANQLIRFDTITGAQTMVVQLPGTGDPATGLGLARNAGVLVALVAQGTTVSAYNAVTGAAVGQFSAASLPVGFQHINGVGSSDTTTILSDSSINLAQTIDVTQSLATGQAVAIGNSFTPARQFGLSGGVTGVAGSNTIYTAGGARFDTFTPNNNYLGILALSNNAGVIRETSRTAVTALGQNIPNPNPASRSVPLGSSEASLAIAGPVVNGRNIVTLYSPSGLSSQGTIALNNANPLTALSASFHPELVNTVLVDVQGNVQTFSSKNATGLAFNNNGNLNLIKIQNATDSSIIGLPVGHVDIARRNNVTITSSNRTFVYQGGVANIPNFTRGGVTINSNIRPIGPLSLPNV